MDESEEVDPRLASALKSYATEALLNREPEGVAARAIGRTDGRRNVPWMPAAITAALILGLIVATTAAFVVSLGGSSAATAEVNGKTYGLVVARSLRLDPTVISSYGSISHLGGGLPLDGDIAYSIKGVDPSNALVVPLKDGSRDGAGSLGVYALLIRGSFVALCPYFSPGSNYNPSECRAD